MNYLVECENLLFILLSFSDNSKRFKVRKLVHTHVFSINHYTE